MLGELLQNKNACHENCHATATQDFEEIISTTRNSLSLKECAPRDSNPEPID